MSSHGRPTAVDAGHVRDVVTITHPFHPRRGEKIEFVMRTRRWGEERVLYRSARGYVASLPARWTSLEPVDPFVVMAAGRARFRAGDLLELSSMVSQVRS